jgi:hypothetical protein
MKHNLLIAINLINLVVMIIFCCLLFKTIIKHSVHPDFGNYKTHDSRGMRCSPWDSCK